MCFSEITITSPFVLSDKNMGLLPNRSFFVFLEHDSFYEKTGVLESVESWQLCRTARNLAAHDYDIDHADIAAHFNSLKTLTSFLYLSAFRFLNYCLEHLDIVPKQADFTTELMLIVKTKQIDESGLIQ